MTTTPWTRGPLLGAALGLPILGGGGRLAMRAIAVVGGAPAVATVEGTLTVLLAGLASGVGGGVLYALLARLLPERRGLRAALFALGLLLLTLRGLRPVQPLALALFLPPVVLYGALLDWGWHRRAAGRRLAGAAA